MMVNFVRTIIVSVIGNNTVTVSMLVGTSTKDNLDLIKMRTQSAAKDRLHWAHFTNGLVNNGNIQG